MPTPASDVLQEQETERRKQKGQELPGLFKDDSTAGRADFCGEPGPWGGFESDCLFGLNYDGLRLFCGGEVAEFFADDVCVLGGFDADTYGIGPDTNDGHHYFVADSDPLTGFS